MSLTIGLVLPNPTLAHGGSGGGGSGGGGSGGGGSGGGSGGGNGGGNGGGSGGNGGGAGDSSSSGSSSAGGGGNGPGMTHGRGNGTARGGGFGRGHAGVGNPGHNALSARNSHSQNTSHKGGTHDGRGFSNHTRSRQSVAQHHMKANQVAQVADRGPGKEKGFVDSLPPGQELKADRGAALNPKTNHSNLDNTVTRGLAPGLELNLDRGVLNPETINSDLADVVTGGLLPGLELNPDRGVTLNLDTIHSNLDDITPRGLPPGFEPNLGRDNSLQAKVAPGTSVPATDDTPATALPRRWELRDGRAMSRSTNPELDDDDDKWKFIPYIGAVVLFFLWIGQSWPIFLNSRRRLLLKPLQK
jgi:hypothetical protein